MNKNSKVIFTMTEPDDLYIIGMFPWSKNLETLINTKFGERRLVGITDDYSSIGVMGRARTKIANICETVGSFLLLTKTEWESVRDDFQNDSDFSFYDLSDEEYAICIHNYYGPVEVDVVDKEGQSLLPEYDHTEDLMYQKSLAHREYREEVVLLNSGFKTTRMFVQQLYGYRRDVVIITKYVFIDDETKEEHICKTSDAKENWSEIGKQTIKTEKWVKY